MSSPSNEEKLSGHRILITGGTGFIGTALAERLCDDNELLLFDKAGSGGPFSYTDLASHSNVRVIDGDILDRVALGAAVDGVDVVIHAAAIVGVREVLSQPRRTIEVNFSGASNLLDAIQRPGDLHRFIYFSTSEVFGDSSFRVEEDHQASIGTVREARWSYSISKLAGEHLAYAHYVERALPVVIVRPFNVFGPRRTGDHAILQFVLKALRNQPIEVHGDGTQLRAWCYIDDFVDAVISTLIIPGAVGHDFNIGSPLNTLTIYDLAKRIIQLANSDSEVVFRKVHFSDIDIRVPKTTKAYDILGFEPKFELDEALTKAIEWYRKHLDHLPTP